MTFPEIFQEFCRQNDIDISIYDRPQRQYFYSPVGLDEIRQDSVGLIGKASPVLLDSLANFYSIAEGNDKIPSFKFSSSELYKKGRLFPMDLSSGFAVSLLNLKPTDHLLDLCCAPGGKLVLASFIQGTDPSVGLNFNEPERIGTLTGVDLSSHRLATCRSLVKKYRLPAVRLFCADGTSFNAPPKTFSRGSSDDSYIVNDSSSLEAVNRPFHESTAFRKRPTMCSNRLYDKVLVDAQCTHDGSIKHIQKHRSKNNNYKDMDLGQFTLEGLEKLYQLQFDLLNRGFELLAPGGILVYSTCSLSRRQNEGIISKFLSLPENSSAIPLPFEGSDELGQMRLCPPVHDSGFFICRIQKRSV